MPGWPVMLALVFSGLAALAAGQSLPVPPPGPEPTVRWEDATQRDTVVIEARRYRCRVATLPAHILSLEVDGKQLLGPRGASFRVADAAGNTWQPAPEGTLPDWKTFQGQSYQQARGPRARMNVWSSGPYYWDAHVLDIPFINEAGLAHLRATQSAPPLLEWNFAGNDHGWVPLERTEVSAGAEALQVRMTGFDPFIGSPAISVPGPVDVVIRMRSRNGGGSSVYWVAGNEKGFSGGNVVSFGTEGDNQWHDYSVSIPETRTLTRLRLDPPGEDGLAEIQSIRLVRRTPVPANLQPIRGELVFHAFRDQLRVELRLDPPAATVKPTRVLLDLDAAGNLASVGRARKAMVMSNAALLLPAGSAAASPGAISCPATGPRRGAVWALGLPSEGAIAGRFADDLAPLSATAIGLAGAHWLGYDTSSGLYRIATEADPGAYGFEQAFKVPHRRMETGLTITGTAGRRPIVVKCLTGVGCLEAAVLADPHGFPLPVPVQVSKNFGGEMEEPDDSAFGDSYFPIDPARPARIQLFHLMQDWGDHMIKQVSSIRFFHIYWHLSTGCSESTCFTMDWMLTGRGSMYNIPDFRPMSGPMWRDQPQHGVPSFPGWLQYGDVRLVFERTDFESISPCLARFTNRYHTSDDAATATVSGMEIPQRDEMRTFLRVRYDWHKPVTIPGDARLTFRWMNMNDRFRSNQVVWHDASGKLQTRDISHDDTPTLLGEPLAAEYPVVGAQGAIGAPDANPEGYHSLMMVRGFKARLGGKAYSTAAASGLFGKHDGDYWLTVPTKNLELQPGDFIEAEVMVMPHGEPAPIDLKPNRERAQFGIDGPGLQASIGKVIATFPATVAAVDGVAQVQLTGGNECLPLIVRGLPVGSVPLLWRDGVWLDQQCHGGDGYQVEPDGKGGVQYVFAIPTRHNQVQNLLITCATAQHGIAALKDGNSRPVVLAAAPGRLGVTGPTLFAPGANQVTAGSNLARFTGATDRAAAIPMAVETPGADSVVTVTHHSGESVEATCKGGALTLSVGGLVPDGVYTVTVGAASRRATARRGLIRVPVPAGTTHVAIRRK